MPLPYDVHSISLVWLSSKIHFLACHKNFCSVFSWKDAFCSCFGCILLLHKFLIFKGELGKNYLKIIFEKTWTSLIIIILQCLQNLLSPKKQPFLGLRPPPTMKHLHQFYCKLEMKVLSSCGWIELVYWAYFYADPSFVFNFCDCKLIIVIGYLWS